MDEHGRQILQMLAEGRITTDDAARLLDALRPPGAAVAPAPASALSPAPASAPRPRARYLRVVVDDSGGEGYGPSKVDVRVPLQLLRAGVQLASLVPPPALARVNEKLAESGVPIDLAQLKPQHVEELIEALDEMTVSVDEPGTTVRVYCE